MDYITGTGAYKGKDEVVETASRNLPDWAGQADNFWRSSDRNERANGRTYVSFVIAVPHEVAPENRLAWAMDLIEQKAPGHAMTAGLHAEAGNPHVHVMLCQRATGNAPEPDFFKRKNPKNRRMNEQSWCDELQAAYLEKVLQVSPNFVATPAGFGGQKRGPEGPRKARRTRVGKGRTLGSYDEEITALQREIDALSAPKPQAKPVQKRGFRPG